MYNKETHVSEHFSKKEVTYSPTAEKYKIDNTPSKEQWKRIQILVDNVLEPVRVGLDKSLTVNSIFRSAKLNERVKGSGTSQHLANNGAAADIECPSLGNKELFDYILNNCNFDQLIWEYGDKSSPDWIHVSFVSEEKNRNQVLRCVKDVKGNPKYFSFLY
jgi:zinc D-Ala-D-Ala carboxypeptidase